MTPAFDSMHGFRRLVALITAPLRANRLRGFQEPVLKKQQLSSTPSLNLPYPIVIITTLRNYFLCFGVFLMNTVLKALDKLSHAFNASYFAARPYVSTRNGFAKDGARLRSNFQSVARDLNSTTRATYGKQSAAGSTYQ